MGRKKKLVNNTTIPQYAIERFARCVFDDIRADFANPEIQADFAIWQAEQAAKKAELKLHSNKKRAASTAALVFLFRLLFAPWSSWSGFGTNLPTIRKIGILIPREINK